MSTDQLNIAFDKILYDKDIGMSVIEGWAFNTLTMEPVEIETSVPALVNTVYRLDLNRNIHIPDSTPYGFFILLPGDYRKYKPVLTFKSFPSTREVKLQRGMRFPLIQKVESLKKYLRSHGLFPQEKPQTEDLEKYRKNYANGELKEWIETIEPETFSYEAELKTSLTYILKTDTEDIDETVTSIRETNPSGEILVVSDKDLNIEGFESFTPENGESLAELKNKAIEKAKGDYIVFVDNKDTLAPAFYNEVNKAIEENPEADFIYSDNDLIDENGRRYDANFKPGFNQVLLSHTNYILYPVIIKKELLKKIGGFRDEFKGLKDYDLVLRATKEAKDIVHIPHLLYHWNKETGNFFELRRKDSEEGLAILNDYLKDTPLQADFSEIDYIFSNTLKGEYPEVTIICGVVNGFSDKGVIRSIEEILNTCRYPNYKVIAINTEEFTDNPKVKFVKDTKAQSLNELFNRASKEADSKLLLFIEPTFRGVVGSWLTEMVDLIEQPNVGIVGPKFFNNSFTFESLGTVIDTGEDGVCQYSIGKDTYIQTKGMNSSWLIPKEVFALSHGALLIDKELFDKIGGFDMSLLPSNQVIDLSIRARNLGYKTVNSRNTPVILDDFVQNDGLSVEELIDKHGKEALIDNTENINIKPNGSATPFIREK